jgi:hypothetical protein
MITSDTSDEVVHLVLIEVCIVFLDVQTVQQPDNVAVESFIVEFVRSSVPPCLVQIWIKKGIVVVILIVEFEHTSS